MLLPKTLGWPKEDETFLKKLMLLLSLQLLLHFHITFMADCISFSITDFILLHYLHSPYISFDYISYFYHKFHFQDSCCLHHKFHLAATSIADFILDVTDFILTSRVTLMEDFILLTTLVSFHTTSYFHHKIHITDFILLHFIL